jgi:chorismate-pyruvate lyase
MRIRQLLCMIGGAAGCAALLAGFARGDDSIPARSPVWPDSFAGRVAAMAVLETLNAELLSHDSATATLENWCGSHRLASPPTIVAERVSGIDKAPSPEQLRDLKVAPSEPIRYRRVRLLCGQAVLSEADNWYVPSRLTPQMNELLDTSDVPFGKVVKALAFRRHTLSAALLWLPLPAGWEMAGAQTPPWGASPSGARRELVIPQRLLQHRAVLTLPDGTPFSEVVETYTRNVLAFPPPPAVETRAAGDGKRR